jgi:predicted ABC-type ATPase
LKDRPLLWLLAGPNGAGKSSFYEFHLKDDYPSLPFVNADLLARERWGSDAVEHGYQASRLAAEWRKELLAARRSFVSETVFSHPSKLELIDQAKSLGYQVILVFIYVEVEVALARVAYRVRVEHGHDVPPDKIETRHARLLPLIAQAIAKADRAEIFYNGDAGAIGHRRIASVVGADVHWRVDPPPAWAQRLVEEAQRHIGRH